MLYKKPQLNLLSLSTHHKFWCQKNGSSATSNIGAATLCRAGDSNTGDVCISTGGIALGSGCSLGSADIAYCKTGAAAETALVCETGYYATAGCSDGTEVGQNYICNYNGQSAIGKCRSNGSGATE